MTLKHVIPSSLTHISHCHQLLKRLYAIRHLMFNPKSIYSFSYLGKICNVTLPEVFIFYRKKWCYQTYISRYSISRLMQADQSAIKFIIYLFIYLLIDLLIDWFTIYLQLCLCFLQVCLLCFILSFCFSVYSFFSVYTRQGNTHGLPALVRMDSSILQCLQRAFVPCQATLESDNSSGWVLIVPPVSQSRGCLSLWPGRSPPMCHGLFAVKSCGK